MEGPAPAGRAEPGRAGRSVPARRWVGAGPGGGGPRRRTGCDRRRPAGARPGGGGVCRAVGGRQRRVPGWGPARGPRSGAVPAGHRRPHLRRGSAGLAAGCRCAGGAHRSRPDRPAWGKGTRVRVVDGAVVAFGKHLEEPGIDCGGFLLPAEVFGRQRQAASEGDHSLAGAVTRLAQTQPLRAVALPAGCWWQDVDTPRTCGRRSGRCAAR
jgi:hypothetical protein